MEYDRIDLINFKFAVFFLSNLLANFGSHTHITIQIQTYFKLFKQIF